MGHVAVPDFINFFAGVVKQTQQLLSESVVCCECFLPISGNVINCGHMTIDIENGHKCKLVAKNLKCDHVTTGTVRTLNLGHKYLSESQM